MRCVKCGTEIDTKATLPDGTLQCPGCGAVYRPKTASESPQGPFGRLGGTRMPKQPKQPRKRREKKPIKHLTAKIVLCLLAIAALVFLGGQLYGRLFYKAPQSEEKTTAVQDDNYLLPSVDLDHVIKDGGTLYASNEIILSAADGTTPRDVEDFIAANNWTLIGYDKPLGLYLARLPYDYTTAEDFERARATALTNFMFEEAYLNYVFPVEANVTLDEYKNATVSNDKEYMPLNNNKTRYWGQTAIYLPQAYARLSGVNLSEISVGVIDNQFYIHDDVRIWEALASEYNPSADKPNHGTHVAGIIGAVRNNNLGIGGINDKIRLHCYRVNGFDTSRKQRNEYGNTFTWLSTLSSVLFNYDCKVINLSMGIPWGELAHDDGSPMTMEEKRQTATKMLNSQMYYTRNVMRKLLRQHDFLLIVAAGNDNNSDGVLCEAKYCTPFAFIEDEEIKSHIIVVGNLAENHNTGDLYIADSSNYGDRVDILAPGTDIYSTVAKKNVLRSWWLGQDVFESGYEYMSGTSMAAPQVTGVAALLWSINPQFTSAQVREFILNSAGLSYTYRQGQSFTRNEYKPLMDAEHAVANALLAMGVSYSNPNPSEPATTAEPSQSSSSEQGILAVSYEGGKGYVYSDTQSFKCTTSKIDLDFIDPNTGNVTHYRTFSTLDTRSCTIYNGLFGQNTYGYYLNFNDEMTVMTATLTMSNGERHIGWVDQNGQFFDVSDKITVQSDFGGAVHHIAPAIFKNYYYFRDIGGTKGALKRVPLNNLTPSAVETLVENTTWDGTYTYPYPDGSIEDGGQLTYYDESKSQAMYISRCVDWINAHEWVGQESKESLVQTHFMIYRYHKDGKLEALGFYDERTPLVPDINDRSNYSPVLSPDNEKVAFLSQLDTGETGLFIVSSYGGDPIKVPTSFEIPFKELTATKAVALLDWIGANDVAALPMSVKPTLTPEPETKYGSFKSKKLMVTEDTTFYAIDRSLGYTQKLQKGATVTWEGEDDDDPGWVRVSIPAWFGYVEKQFLTEAE